VFFLSFKKYPLLLSLLSARTTSIIISFVVLLPKWKNLSAHDKILQASRLQLIIATKQVLQNGLGLLGVSAPEKM
jgi:hypothetical protein